MISTLRGYLDRGISWHQAIDQVNGNCTQVMILKNQSLATPWPRKVGCELQPDSICVDFVGHGVGFPKGRRRVSSMRELRKYCSAQGQGQEVSAVNTLAALGGDVCALGIVRGKPMPTGIALSPHWARLAQCVGYSA